MHGNVMPLTWLLTCTLDIVKDNNEMQIGIANEKAGFHSLVNMKEQPNFCTPPVLLADH